MTMTNEKLAELMNHNNADLEYLEELTDALREEMAKPLGERDRVEIKELIEAISEICITEQNKIEQTAASITMRNASLSQTEPEKKRRFALRRLIPAVVAAAIVTANVFSYSVFGMNAFSSAVRIMDGSIQISFSNDVEFKGENPYSQQMLEKCQEAGFTSLVPKYLPPNMKPTDLWGEINESSITEIEFDLSDGKNSLIFLYINIKDAQDGIELGIPSNTNALSVEIFSGVTIYFLKETSSEFHVSFQHGQIVYHISSDGVSEDEFRKIIYSLFA